MANTWVQIPALPLLISMNNALGFLRNYSKISQIDEVLELMVKLETNLAKLDLENLKEFNKTYRIITSDVKEKLGNGFFSNDKWMEKLDVVFAKFYFKALVDYIDDGNPPKAWQFAFDSIKKSNKPKYIYLLLGVNAHINSDLPIVVAKLFNKNRKGDFISINKILEGKIDLIIKELNGDSKLLRLMQGIFRPMYQDFVINMLISWREEAWEKAGLMKNSKDKSSIVKQIESDALKKAKEIALLSL